MNEPRCDIDRTITLPQSFVDRLVEWPPTGGGRMLEIPVQVNWPELQLSERQILANSMALVAGKNDPYPDPSIFCIRVPYPNPSLNQSPTLHKYFEWLQRKTEA